MNSVGNASGKSVVLLGLGREEACIPTAAEIWTMNDWYVSWPRVPKVARIYNIHATPGTHADNPRRFPGDWRQRYADSGAELVLFRSVGLPRERLFDMAAGEVEFGRTFFNSTWCYMLADAIWEGVARVYIHGCRMQADEYRWQAPGLLTAIATARSRGVEVVAPLEKDWLETVDWAACVKQAIKAYPKEAWDFIDSAQDEIALRRLRSTCVLLPENLQARVTQ
jgi:hypothetical protein